LARRRLERDRQLEFVVQQLLQLLRRIEAEVTARELERAIAERLRSEPAEVVPA